MKPWRELRRYLRLVCCVLLKTSEVTSRRMKSNEKFSCYFIEKWENDRAIEEKATARHFFSLSSWFWLKEGERTLFISPSVSMHTDELLVLLFFHSSLMELLKKKNEKEVSICKLIMVMQTMRRERQREMTFESMQSTDFIIRAFTMPFNIILWRVEEKKNFLLFIRFDHVLEDLTIVFIEQRMRKRNSDIWQSLSAKV